MNVTLIKKDRGKATRSKADIAFVVQLMQEQRLRYQINQFWERYPIVREHPQFLDEEMREFTSNLPVVCFITEHRKLCHELHADRLPPAPLPLFVAAGSLLRQVRVFALPGRAAVVQGFRAPQDEP